MELIDSLRRGNDDEELAKDPAINKSIDDSARRNDENEKLAKEPAEIIIDSSRRESLSMQAQFLNAARKSVPSAVEAATILGGTGQWVLSRISYGGAGESPEPHAAVAEDYTLDDEILGEGIWGTVYKGSRLNAAGELEQVAIKKLDKKQKDKEGKMIEKQDASTQLVEMEKECRLNHLAHELSKPATSSLGCARLEVRARHCVMVPHMHSYKEGTAIMQFVQGTILEKYIRGPGYAETPKRQRSIEDVAFAARLRSVCHVVVKKVCKLLLLGRGSEFSHRDLNDGNLMIEVKHTIDPTTSLATPSSDPEDIAVWMIDFGKSMAKIDGERVRADPFAEPAMATAAHACVSTMRCCTIHRARLRLLHGRSPQAWEVRTNTTRRLTSCACS